MAFEIGHIKAALQHTPGTLRHLLGDLPESLSSANEGAGTWSPFDVMGHLIHGEKTDWIPRARIILFEDDKRFEPFDRFAQEKESIGKSMGDLLAEFGEWRIKSLEALDSFDLSPEHLAKTGFHPEFGEVTLQQLLATWASHDYGHLYQLSRILSKQFLPDVGPWKRNIRALND